MGLTSRKGGSLRPFLVLCVEWSPQAPLAAHTVCLCVCVCVHVCAFLTLLIPGRSPKCVCLSNLLVFSLLVA